MTRMTARLQEVAKDIKDAGGKATGNNLMVKFWMEPLPKAAQVEAWLKGVK